MTVEIKVEGKVLFITAPNGRTIAEILFHGPFESCMINAANNLPIKKGTANIFRGELYGLTGYEYLNVKEGRVEEK